MSEPCTRPDRTLAAQQLAFEPATAAPKSPGNTIVHVAEFGAPYASSFVSSLRALTPCLERAGLRQVLVLPARARQRQWAIDWAAEQETPLFFLSAGTLWARAKEVASIVQREGAVLIHSHFCPADWITWFARLRLRTTFASPIPPLVWHYQSPPISDGFARHLLGPFKYRWLARSIHHVAVSEGILEGMLARGIPGSRCRLVPNSISIERATTAANSRQEVRSALGITAGQKCFLLFGHDPLRKGVDLALKAAAALHREHPDLVLIMVGQERMRGYIREFLEGSEPAWLRIVEPREAVADYYSAADFFLSPSRAEGLPYAVLEALANRLPVAASDIAGLEWARSLEAVRLFPSGDAASLADRMKHLLHEQPEDRKASAAQAYDYIREHHSTEVWAREMVSIYSTLIESHQNGRWVLASNQSATACATSGNTIASDPLLVTKVGDRRPQASPPSLQRPDTVVATRPTSG